MTQVNITRASPLPTSDLVVTGAKADGTPSLIRGGLQLPQPVADVAYAPAPPWLHGDVPTSKRFPNAILAMRVRIEAATEDAHRDIVDAWRKALSDQMTYTATVVVGDRTDVWKCYPGSIVVTNGDRTSWPVGQPVVDWYTITIPVHPIQVS